MAGSNYTKIPKELDHHKNGLINIQSVDDNECFKSCLVRCLHPADHYPARIRKADKDFARKLDFKDIKFPVKFRDIHKIKKKKNSIAISLFGYENKENYRIYLSRKCCEEKHFDLLLIGEKGKNHYVLVKNVNAFMYDHKLHRVRKHFCCYCLQAFSTEANIKTLY